MFYDPNCKPAPVKLEPYQEVLLRAIGLIERQGWCQGRLRADDGPVCPEEALREAAGHDTCLWHPAMAALVQYLGGQELFVWNDQPGRTKEEVVAALRGAAI